jgi:cytochrome c peroxidase
MRKISLIAVMLWSASVGLLSGCGKENANVCEEAAQNLEHIPYEPVQVNLQLPMGYPAMPQPADNLLTEDGIQLGRHLFFDKILSGDLTMGCSDCHRPEYGFTDGRRFSTGIDGIVGSRSAMPLFNVGFASEVSQEGRNFMWDGRFNSLEQQALAPTEDPIELHGQWPDIECRLRAHPTYPALFRKAFGIRSTDEITRELVAKALAQFQRTLVVGANSKYYRAQFGLETLTDAENRGRMMFFANDTTGQGLPDAECAHCHNGSQFTNFRFVNNGLQPAQTLQDFVDFGLGRVNGRSADNGKFKTPSLWNVAMTAPYMHAGQLATLEEVIDHYDTGGEYSPNRATELVQLEQAPAFTPQQKADLIAFLHTLTDTAYLSNPLYTSPF